MTLAAPRLVRVPASSANLGPGFDVLAAALSLPLEVEVVETGEFAVVTDLDVRATARTCRARVRATAPADGFEFRISSKIPLSGGLGSSAAAIVAGLVAADHIFELDADVRALANELEGHPDNVGAALNGGFVICDATGVHRFDPPMGLEAVLVVPHEPVRTAEARAALPATGPAGPTRSFNIAAVAPADARPGQRQLDLIAGGLQRPPAPALPGAAVPALGGAAGARAEAGALGATISGAGPTVLVWYALRADRRGGRGAGAPDARLGAGDPGAVRAAGRLRARPVIAATESSRGRAAAAEPSPLRGLAATGSASQAACGRR